MAAAALNVLTAGNWLEVWEQKVSQTVLFLILTSPQSWGFSVTLLIKDAPNV